MSNKWVQRAAILTFWILAAIIIDKAYGSGDDLTAVAKAEATLTGGDVTTNMTTGDSRAIGLGNALGDVDFTAPCKGSDQFYLVVYGKQRIVTDHTCIGFAWLKLGVYHLAAMHFCMDPETLAKYPDEASCRQEHDLAPAEPSPDLLAGLLARIDDLEQRMAEARTAIDVEHEELQQQVAEVATRPPPKRAPVVVEQRPLFTEEQRDGLLALKYEDEDDE